MFDKIMLWWKRIQQLASIDGGLYIDAFALVMLVRLIGPLRGFPAMTPSEAGMWSATIAAFAVHNFRGPRQP